MNGAVRSRSLRISLSLLAAGLLWPSAALRAQVSLANPARPLVTQAIDESKTVSLRGTVHPLAQARFDQGPVPDSFPANRMMLILNRTPEREAALKQFLADAHTQGSPSYHRWITPAQFGESFGPADSDIQAATSWLASHGFQVARVTAGKGLIEFSGTAANVREAFHTQIHRYRINDETHYANSGEIAIPAALAPLIRAVSAINNFRAKPALRAVGSASYSRDTHRVTPQFSLPSGSPTFFAVAPEDFATQYDLGPLYTAGTNGSGQTIGIIAESNIDITLPQNYEQMFSLPPNPPQVIIDGNDPGIDPLPDSDLEAYLDVELAGSVAPGATINLYISDGSDVQDPITLAAVRAVTDDQASILSLSVSECEANLSSGMEAFWLGLWEQAAAQGQTVFVASGDSGPAACDFDAEAQATEGLAVNGIASTPWNVAVGGTDFFYPDFASGASAATPFWNATNDAKNGSLKASLPEQPWDEPFGSNISGNTNIILATGGGASSCAPPADGLGCNGGFPKPIWQSATGVPNDGVRDLPDVSLFAAGGSNLSAYPICAFEGQCAPGANSTIELVGGTSAAAPAMAGIMALVDQKFGRQGQADFTLYALARQQPAVFHDVTVGTNNVPCVQASPNCSLDTDGDGLFSLQEYPAGAGYDLASGLGSVDGNLLVADWNKVSFTATTTTLDLSQNTFEHGALVTVNIAVAPSAGAGVPTGEVTLLTNTPYPMQRNSALQLSGGTANEAFDFFPGGTYQVTAQYSGDGVFGPSTSAPVTVTVTPEPSSILFIIYGPNGDVVNGPSQAGYGQRWILSALPFGMNGFAANGLATGSVTFTNGASSHVEPLNSIGNAAYSPGPADLPVGPNPITLSYAGDASYQASTAGPFTITITQGSPLIFIGTVQSTVERSSSLTVSAQLGTGFGVAPTGNVTFSLGSASVTVPVTASMYAGLPYGIATATLTNLPPPGTYRLGVSYAGDSNWHAAVVTSGIQTTIVSTARAASNIALAINPTSITHFQSTSFTANVSSASGTGPAPSGTVIFYVNGLGLPGGLSASGGSSSAASPSAPISAQLLANGANSVTATYSGDSNYLPSTSTAGTVTVANGTFSISLGESHLVVPSGESGMATVNLESLYGFNAALPLTCATSSGAISCSLNPAIPMVNGPTTAALTVNAFALVQQNAISAPPIGSRRLPPAILIVSALGLFLAFSRAPRRIPARLRLTLSVVVLALLVAIASCGGGSSAPPPPPPPPQKVPAPAGTYGVVVTATGAGIAHNIKLVVLVQ